MKELIEYNYNIIIDEINDDNRLFSFKWKNDIYLFVIYERSIEEIEEIIECSKELKLKNIISFDIMYNKNNEAITKIDKVNYCLLKIPTNFYEEVDIVKMIEYNKKTYLNENQKKKYKNLWGELWGKKVDYFEYQVSELGKEKKVILDSFGYYIGLAENAIAYVNKLNKENEFGKNDKICLSHRRIEYPNNILNYCNPLSYLFDLEVRDIAEYIKTCFFKGEDAFLELITYLKLVKLTNYSYQMLFARLLYPSYYFDIYENIMINNESEEELIPIIKKIDEYELFLKKIMIELEKYTIVDRIEWLLKV